MNTLKDYVNWKLTHADKVAEAEGYPLTMENCKKNKRMKQLEVYGNSVQDGTPTPEAPIEVQSVGEKSVNLFDANTYSLTLNKVIWGHNGLTGTSAGYAATLDYIPCADLVGKTITISRTGGSNPGIAFYDENKTYISGKNNASSTNTKITTTVPENAVYYRFCVVADYKDTAQIQEGNTATPFEPYGKYKIPVVQRGKNLWDKENYIINQTRDTILRDLYTTDYSWLKKGETITVSATIFVSENDTRTSTRLAIETIGTNGAAYQNQKFNYSTKGEEIRVSLTYTIPEIDADIKTLRIRFIDYSANTENVWDAYVKDIQIELSDTATDYEPYIEPVTTNIFLNEPLRKIGDYADYIDYKENKVVRRVKAQPILSTATISKNAWYHSVGWNAYGYSTKSYPSYSESNYPKEFCTHFQTPNTYASNSTIVGSFSINDTQRMVYFVTGVASDETVADFKAFLKTEEDKGKPVILYYRLAEATEEPLSIDLPKLNAKTSIIEVDTSLAPSNAKGKYIKK